MTTMATIIILLMLMVVDGGKDEDEDKDLPNVAVPLRDSAVSLLDIQLEIIAILIFLVILRMTYYLHRW